MPEMTYVLDSEALSKIALNDRAMSVTLARAHQSSVRVVTSSMTLIEAYHSRIRQPIWDWAMSRVVVEPVTKDIADEAIRLLRSTGLHGHKYAIDAALAVIAGRQRGRVVVFTSDEDDMGKLCRARVLVRGV
ncbi:PIN domain-containing protein [Streptomyces sp. NPDC049967]|uniref:PIN domain-containing protein n=1 Tax=unclassified Streptomyces TaxID=2593676 RepID=UPI002E2C8D23|nr:PIN domain-containing protein [Streptomyces sp. NBC_00304]WRZ13557.1 PIN domain-containing protein [Streptomyces sp. NBC_00341]